jgi:plasmid stability protein
MRPLITHLSEALDAELLRQGVKAENLPDCEALAVVAAKIHADRLLGWGYQDSSERVRGEL